MLERASRADENSGDATWWGTTIGAKGGDAVARYLNASAPKTMHMAKATTNNAINM